MCAPAMRVKLNREGVVKMALIDLGVPPGFTVLAEDLSRLVEKGVIARYELTGRQIIIYLEDLTPKRRCSSAIACGHASRYTLRRLLPAHTTITTPPNRQCERRWRCW